MYQLNNNQVNIYQITENEAMQRIDNFLTKILKGVPKSHIYRIIRSGEIRINSKRCAVSDKLNIGDMVRIPPIRVAQPETPNKFIPAAKFTILYEDEYYLIINKPSGIACHGGSGVSFGVIEQLRAANQYKFLELAHRLDRETSGVLILAKKRSGLVQLQELIRNNQLIKEYYALSVGKWNDDKRNVKLPIEKYLNKDGERRVRIDHENGQFAHTIFTVVKKFAEFTLVNAQLQTGKTHQIRIHLQHLTYPIAGDDKYGDFILNRQLAKIGLKRMFLHAHHVQFTHPITDKIIDIKCELPDELSKFLLII